LDDTRLMRTNKKIPSSRHAGLSPNIETFPDMN